MKVCLFLNHACNLACSYCYNGPKFHRSMPPDVALAGVRLALEDGREGPVQLSFFGGEPLLEMERIRQVVEHAEERAEQLGRGLRFVVVTNATLLTDGVLDYLMEHRFYVGVSIDGSREAHDATRRFRNGRSSYDRVVAGVERLLSRPERRGVKAVAVTDPRNVDHLPDTFDALRALGLRTLSVNLNYEADWHEANRERFLRALRALGDRYISAYRRGERFKLNLLDSKVLTHLKGGYACADRCDFGCEEVAVAPTGNLYPCDRLVGDDTREDVVIGHVHTGIDPVRRDVLIADKNRVFADCADCAFLGRCMHWCGCVNHAMTGSVGQVDGLLCWFEQRLIEEADRCAATLYEEGNAEFLRRFYEPRMRTLVRE